mmetsp:Transcript_10037/g.20321  ORF Transcript_10037/g.20321 Transcript_10037/m.20321 type:complete len:855 (-) Transcript_10037:1565-4129(-)|eukprot:CAMPEP_0184689122 /NCGR_PEP_ID=MMETSP0312-20130426/30479_1 /TAXON_ID=31354 /ORGANISM="Compsopogon coeruleus, Strain SAG 36.94" /LENGTH=854 /DNA_ID=CAMNT_0027146435 /DNA_START=13 /DNA_END=2577 /DNA_ORIENTATION=-
MDVDFRDVLEHSRALVARQSGRGVLDEDGGGPGLPIIERGLKQIEEASRRMVAGDGGVLSSKVRAAASNKGAREMRMIMEDEDGAHLLRAQYGFEPRWMEQNLTAVELEETKLDRYEAVSETDLEALARHQREMMVLGTVEEIRKAAHDRAAEMSVVNMELNWSAQKKNLMAFPMVQHDAFAGGRKPSDSTIPKPQGATRSTLNAFMSPFRGTPSGGGVRSRVDVEYSAVVRSVVQKGSFLSVPDTMRMVAAMQSASSSEERGKDIENVLRAIRFIVRPSQDGAVFSSAGARQCLEALFLESKLRPAIESNPVASRRGGEPGLRADIAAYVSLIFERGVPAFLRGGPTAGQLPLWPQVYYALRCGDMSIAEQILLEASAFLESDQSCSFLDFFKAFKESGERWCLPEAQLTQLIQEFTLHVARSSDPYKRLCYVVLSGLDPTHSESINLVDFDYNLLVNSMEDFAWLKLCSIRDSSSNPFSSPGSSSKAGIEKLREEVSHFGPGHFDPDGKRPFLYAFLLLLCGDFEGAIEYLAGVCRSLTDVVHVALLLRKLKLLSLKTYLMVVIRYVDLFAAVSVAEAALYYFTISELEERQELLSRLVIQTRQLEILFGDSRKPRNSRRGALDELWQLEGASRGRRVERTDLLNKAGDDARALGDRELARKLYEYSGNFDASTSILLNLMNVELAKKDSAKREKLYKEAKEWQVRFERTEELPTENRLLRSFNIMVGLYEFFNLVWGAKYEKAWEVLNALDFLPLSSSQVIPKLDQFGRGGSYVDDVGDAVSVIIITAMELVTTLHSELRRSNRGSNGMTSSIGLEQLEASAHALLTFAGMMNFDGPEVSAKLVRLQVLLT